MESERGRQAHKLERSGQNARLMQITLGQKGDSDTAKQARPRADHTRAASSDSQLAFLWGVVSPVLISATTILIPGFKMQTLSPVEAK